MATYVNNLRLKEIATGDESGTWGTSTNTNLELIGEALGYATEQSFGSDADATTTVADGVSDPARARCLPSGGSLRHRGVHGSRRRPCARFPALPA